LVLLRSNQVDCLTGHVYYRDRKLSSLLRFRAPLPLPRIIAYVLVKGRLISQKIHFYHLHHYQRISIFQVSKHWFYKNVTAKFNKYFCLYQAKPHLNTFEIMGRSLQVHTQKVVCVIKSFAQKVTLFSSAAISNVPFNKLIKNVILFLVWVK
jgi:hypothetical protein